MSRRVIMAITQSKFITRSKVVLLGSTIAQIITFATSFVITAYFTPEDLGLMGTLTALISIVAGTLLFRLDIAIIQASEKESANVFFQSTILSATASLVFCLLCFILPFEFAEKITLFFLPFLLWTWGYFLYFNSRQLPFKFNELQLSARGGILRSSFTLIFQLLGGWISPTFSWLLSGRILGDYVGSIYHWKKYVSLIDFKKSLNHWGEFIKGHKDFILYMTPHHLCIALSQNVIIFFLEKSYGLAIVGFYTLGQRLILAPIEILGASLFNVTIQRYGELQNEPKELRRFYLKVVLFSFVISAIVGGIIWGTIDFFIPVLGNKWLPAAPMVKCLIPYFMNVIFSTPTINFLRFINKSKFQLGMELLELIIKIAFLMIISFSNSNEMVIYFSLFSLGVGIIKPFVVIRLIPNN